MHPSIEATPTSPAIRVRGARTHNLRNIDVDVPRDRLVVITGVSGSGKSSLAFDTLFAEGQRRYLETLSASTRQFLDQMRRPDVDDIEGLPPTLSVEQRAAAVQPRSTLATVTEIHDFLRLLYARVGTLHCHQCGRPVSQQSPQAIVDRILSLETGRKAMILAPLVRARKGKHRELFERIVREGFVRARVDGAIIDAASPPSLNKSKPHDIDVIIDRIVVKDGLRARLQESVELALKHGEGSCLISHQEGDAWHDQLYSSRLACPDCGLSFPDIEPRTFSFNNPQGACPACHGLGTLSPTLQGGAGGGDAAEGASLPPLGRGGRGGRAQSGHSSTPVSPVENLAKSENAERPTPNAERRTAARGESRSTADSEACPDCRGARLGPVARSVRIADRGIHDFAALTVAEAERAADDLLANVQDPAHWLVAAKLVPEITKRLQCLRRLGVDYLTLDRPVASLSSGEYQRARLAGCLGSGLRGVCYVLDEPTIGLHPRDAQRLFETLCELRDQGNSVLIVEHDLDLVRQSDAVIDLGPGAGREGGCVVAAGTPAQVCENPASVTGRYLRVSLEKRPDLAPPGANSAAVNSSWLTVSGANARNLKHVTAQFPLGKLTCVTGVSGSGKSSLVIETLVPLVRSVLNARNPSRPLSDRQPTAQQSAWAGEPGSAPDATSIKGARLSGIEAIDRLIEIDQSPLGRNSRSNPATASGIWDEIRRVFARTRDARVRGFRAGRFSFNSPAGRCDVCRGLGTRRIGMHFLPDIDVLCPACRGSRFNRQTLEVRFRGKSVADVLDLRIDEAVAFFGNFARIRRTLATFVDVGLGYLTLGQSAVTLSGGESQRIRLATELSQPAAGHALYVLDEPTTGLHAADIERLLHLLVRLTEQGHTVIVIEHELNMIGAADFVIDLGPEGGARGGNVVATGTPAEIAQTAASFTGQALRAHSGEP